QFPLPSAFAPLPPSAYAPSFPGRHGCQSHIGDSSLPSLCARPLRSVSLHAFGNRDGAADTATAALSSVSVNNEQSPDFTAFEIRARNRIGLLQVITRVFKVLALRIEKATVEFEGDFFVKRFFVVDSHSRKIEDAESLERIRRALLDAIGAEHIERADGGVPLAVRAASSRGPVVRRGGLVAEGAALEGRAKAETMFALMDGFLKNDPLSLQKDILHHVEYTVARSRFNFDDFEAYQGLSHSVKDRLIERWHDTQQYFKRKNPKRLYFLSLEFLMGIIITL
ncbi:hypothetical protein Taro_001222, partial [Colocasia esculenta]|nr:hypothetical protein [Colocasia esculenta]